MPCSSFVGDKEGSWAEDEAVDMNPKNLKCMRRHACKDGTYRGLDITETNKGRLNDDRCGRSGRSISRCNDEVGGQQKGLVRLAPATKLVQRLDHIESALGGSMVDARQGLRSPTVKHSGSG